MQTNYKCYHCDASFKLKHEMDESYYEVNFCPFCGSDIDEEESEEDE